MSSITIPLEIELTPRSRALMAALANVIGPQFQAPEEPEVQPAVLTALDLQPGEHYAGVVLNEDGSIKHHLVLTAARPTDDLNWQAAMDWAVRVGGSLPTRQEQALLFANCKPHLKPQWYWSSETHKDDASFAWGCHFSNGFQYYDRKSFEGGAVAVRRV